MALGLIRHKLGTVLEDLFGEEYKADNYVYLLDLNALRG